MSRVVSMQVKVSNLEALLRNANKLNNQNNSRTVTGASKQAKPNNAIKSDQ